MERKPPLNALKAFECSARLGSFTRAAEELNVTQAAISHQIKLLEQYLDTTLFHRSPRRLTLTAEAKAYLPSIAQAFELIHSSTSQLFFKNAVQYIHVQCQRTYAQTILLPQLADFYHRHPELRIRLSSGPQANESHSPVDLEIAHFEAGHAPEQAQPLTHQESWIVGHPTLLPRGKKSLSTLEIANLPVVALIDDKSRWESWLETQGLAHLSLNTVFETDCTFSAIQAVSQGLGVFMGNACLLQNALKNGELVKLHQQAQAGPEQFYIVPRQTPMSTPVSLFIQWLKQLRGTPQPIGTPRISRPSRMKRKQAYA